MKYHLVPSILSADLNSVGETVDRLVEAGIRWIQVDVMDGNFVPNLTFGPMLVEAIRRRKPKDLIIDAHLMIAAPERWVADYCKAGADIVTAHVEATAHIHSAMQIVKKAGKQFGAAVNPGTPVSALYDLLPELDLALVMSVNPGFGGQAFIPGALNKVRELRAKMDEIGSDAYLQVDGGIKLDNIGEVAKAGGNSFIAGSGIFSDKSAQKGEFGPVVKAFQAAIRKGARE
jgi:ribulose-phosphate 3-epimerase